MPRVLRTVSVEGEGDDLPRVGMWGTSVPEPIRLEGMERSRGEEALEMAGRATRQALAEHRKRGGATSPVSERPLEDFPSLEPIVAWEGKFDFNHGVAWAPGWQETVVADPTTYHSADDIEIAPRTVHRGGQGSTAMNAFVGGWMDAITLMFRGTEDEASLLFGIERREELRRQKLIAKVEQQVLGRVLEEWERVDVWERGVLSKKLQTLANKYRREQDLHDPLMRNIRGAAGNLQEADELFKKIDTNQDGGLDKEELRAALAQRGIEVGDEDIDEVFHRIDLDGNGRIDMNEFRQVLGLSEEEMEEMERSRRRKAGSGALSLSRQGSGMLRRTLSAASQSLMASSDTIRGMLDWEGSRHGGRQRRRSSSRRSRGSSSGSGDLEPDAVVAGMIRQGSLSSSTSRTNSKSPPRRGSSMGSPPGSQRRLSATTGILKQGKSSSMDFQHSTSQGSDTSSPVASRSVSPDLRRSLYAKGGPRRRDIFDSDTKSDVPAITSATSVPENRPFPSAGVSSRESRFGGVLKPSTIPSDVLISSFSHRGKRSDAESSGSQTQLVPGHQSPPLVVRASDDHVAEDNEVASGFPSVGLSEIVSGEMFGHVHDDDIVEDLLDDLEDDELLADIQIYTDVLRAHFGIFGLNHGVSCPMGVEGPSSSRENINMVLGGKFGHVHDDDLINDGSDGFENQESLVDMQVYAGMLRAHFGLDSVSAVGKNFGFTGTVKPSEDPGSLASFAAMVSELDENDPPNDTNISQKSPSSKRRHFFTSPLTSMNFAFGSSRVNAKSSVGSIKSPEGSIKSPVESERSPHSAVAVEKGSGEQIEVVVSRTASMDEVRHVLAQLQPSRQQIQC